MSDVLTLSVRGPSGAPVGLAPRVFKVGCTNHSLCRARCSDLNTNKRHNAAEKGRPIYAGVRGWRIVGCWPVTTQNYDKMFFKWLEDVDGVLRLAPYAFKTRAKKNGMHEATELCTLSEAFMGTGKTGIAAHELHDKVLAAAREEMLRSWTAMGLR